MPTTTGLTLANEVFFRISGKLTTAQIGPYLNRALNLIEFGGQYNWDVITSAVIVAPAIGIAVVPASVDIGKDIFFTNVDRSPVTRVTSDKDWRPDNVSSSTTNYDSFYLESQSGTSGRFLFYPPLSVPVNVLYHKVTAVLDGTALTSVPWTEQYMDDLLIDFTEMEIKRIANWSGWVELEQRCLSRLREASGRFSSARTVAAFTELPASPPKGA